MAEDELGRSQGTIDSFLCSSISRFGHQELRPQDSIPFLRRVSADLNKSDAARIFNHLDIPESPTAETTPRTDDFVSGSPPNQRRLSNASQRPPVDNDIAPREHSFVKTTFSKRKYSTDDRCTS